MDKRELSNKGLSKSKDKKISKDGKLSKDKTMSKGRKLSKDERIPKDRDLSNRAVEKDRVLEKGLPERYEAKESELKWQRFWEKEGIYRFDLNSKAEIYSIDTPPPTVSGKMHIGHAFSYSHQDFIVRFQRMLGKNIFYPFGTDDNGIPTERLIEKTKKVKAGELPRSQFIKLCFETLEKELRPNYIKDWKRLGMSCQWDIYYTTISEHCQRLSQKSFIELFRMKRAYRKEAPAMWCPECQTGISQAECQDRLLDSYFNELVFKVDGRDLIIATTRPELLPACVAVFYHPEDERYKKYKGKKAKVPLFGFEVPIMPDEKAEPEKGTGIVMCCTFGDQTDMEWQRSHNLPIKEAITKDGKMSRLAGRYEGMPIQTARRMILDELKKEGLCIGQKPVRHAVNVHERCGTEIEFIHSKQWFIRYLDLKKEMIEWGRELNWYPRHMESRYEHWVNGLQWDWLISRQRYFGIPFPVWYCKKCDEVILAGEDSLPVDPLKDAPPIDECPKCSSNEFIPEKDVLDTWATSSLSPRLSIELMPERIQKQLYPMSLRPQAHDIITFWLFNTVVKSQLHYKKNPWKDVMISGHALDPHGKKMSKSRGNVVEPNEVIEKYSADCLRFWAAGSKLGDDLPYMEKDIVTAHRFITKLWNASKFAVMHLQDYRGENPKKLEVIDRWLLSKLNRIIRESTESFLKYEYSKTKTDVENFFWHEFCGNYLEIIKDRLYNPDKRGKDSRISAQYALYSSLLSLLKMMAPIMPHITEEIYQSYFIEHEKPKSVHISAWPTPIWENESWEDETAKGGDETGGRKLDEEREGKKADEKTNKRKADEKAEKLGDLVVCVLQKVRAAKSEKSLSLKTNVRCLYIKGDIPEKDFELVKGDLMAAARAEKIVYERLKDDSESKDNFESKKDSKSDDTPELKDKADGSNVEVEVEI